ncbi:probable RNA-binding protein 46 isoform X1 [Drosophila elegans]|uniref:probable RNA-binding protein 46 isoform X1 n=1 Tax=Drosophila elegans TaxID=30023 RepID=UPI0007E5BD10|nr:probable RNA-binding protein 46 isoform X1 [Drosophila elegans]
MDFENFYRTSQVNGTIYITTRKELDKDLKSSLEEGAGELFLTAIRQNPHCTPEKIVEVASELGEIYALRFKIDFSGQSRGYAYLQYINEALKEAALEYLPRRFSQLNIQIRVLTSNNNRELLLNRVHKSFSPWQVYQEMRKIYPFAILRVYEFRYNEFIYIFGYRNNDAAANAHQSIRNAIRRFGGRAHISWFSRKNYLSGVKVNSYCCRKLDKENIKLVPGIANNCFKF